MKLKAERKAGELLRELKRSPAGRKNALSVERISEYSTALKEAKATRADAHRWQTAAPVPEEQFHSYLADTRAVAGAPDRFGRWRVLR